MYCDVFLCLTLNLHASTKEYRDSILGVLILNNTKKNAKKPAISGFLAFLYRLVLFLFSILLAA